MNKVDFQQTGGFPLETDTLDFMQNSFSVLQVLAAIGGDNFILSGVAVVGVNVSNGYVVINGEVLPFVGGLLQTYVMIREDVTSRPFENGTVKEVFRSRYVSFGNGQNSIPFVDLVRIKDLKAFRDLPTSARSAIDFDSDASLATSKAVKLLNDKINGLVPAGMIMIWSGTIATIPPGWKLCDGADGRPDLRDRFVLGAGNQYAVGVVDGEKEHTLSLNEIPEHFHQYGSNAAIQGQKYKVGNGNDPFEYRTSGGNAQSGSAGGGLPHNNMPPYFSLAYIIKLP